MKNILLIILLLPFAALGQISVIDSATHVIIQDFSGRRTYPKSAVGVRLLEGRLYLMQGEQTIKTIVSNNEVTTPVSSSIADLETKVIGILATGSGGGIGAATTATFTNKTMAWGSNTFTGFPYVPLSGGVTIAGTNTFSGVTTFSATTVTANIAPETNGVSNIGGPSNRYLNGYFSAINGNGAVTINTSTTTGIGLQQTSSSNRYGGWYGTSGRMYLLAPGAVPTEIPTSRLTINSTTEGVLLPRMTTAQKNAISSPAEGLEVYDTDLHAKCFYNGTVWKTVATL